MKYSDCSTDNDWRERIMPDKTPEEIFREIEKIHSVHDYSEWIAFRETFKSTIIKALSAHYLKKALSLVGKHRVFNESWNKAKADTRKRLKEGWDK